MRGRGSSILGRRATALLGASVAVLVVAAPAPAATIEVDIEFDQFGGPTPIGVDPLCSLREAVQAANADLDFDGCEREGTGAADTILLTGGTTYPRTRGGVDDTNSGGDLDIAGETTLKVVGPGLATIDGDDLDRVIEVHDGASLSAKRLAITDGRVPGFDQPGSGGGGIRNLGTLTLNKVILFDNEAQRAANGCGCGGGIENRGRMTLDRVELKHNYATFDGGGLFVDGDPQVIRRSAIEGNSSFSGGGMYVGSALSLNGSTIALNDATGSSVRSEGGGLFLGASDGDVLSIVNSTITGNRAADGGGGIFVFSGPLDVNGVTITANTADYLADGSGHGGGIDGGGFGPIIDNDRLRNTILAGNLDLNPTDPQADCFRMFADLGSHSLFSPTGGCPAGPKNVLAPKPKLKPLAENGGPTMTHALTRKSAAVGEASPGSAPKRDQRGVKRDKRPDIGAFER